ncbi:MAG: hypothetical protein ACYSUC_12250 [Planctomycetota bacterium]|jgi:hypothetical protein
MSTNEKFPRGPYIVLGDGSTFDLARISHVVMLTAEGEAQLEPTRNDMQDVSLNNMHVVPLSLLLDMYNEYCGTCF